MALDRSRLQAGVPGACRSICSASPGARGNPFHAERARAYAGSKAAAFQHHSLPPLWGCEGEQVTLLQQKPQAGLQEGLHYVLQFTFLSAVLKTGGMFCS